MEVGLKIKAYLEENGISQTFSSTSPAFLMQSRERKVFPVKSSARGFSLRGYIESRSVLVAPGGFVIRAIIVTVSFCGFTIQYPEYFVYA